MAKSGLNAMTVALADAFGPKVRVNCILPGRDPDRHLQGVERGDDRQRPQDADGPGRLRRGLPGRGPVLRQRGLGVDHRHVPARRRRRGPPAGPVVAVDADGCRTTSSGMFADNAAEFGIAYDGPPVVRRESVAVDGGRQLSALVWGDGPPAMVLVHGGAQNAHTWDTVALALGRPLVAVDLPGHGHSDGGRNGSLDVASNAADVAEVIRGAGARRPRRRRHVARRADDAGPRRSTRRSSSAPVVLVDITPGVTAEKAKAITAFVNGPALVRQLRRPAGPHDGAQPDPHGVVAAPGHPAQRPAEGRRDVGVALRPLAPSEVDGERRRRQRRGPTPATTACCGTPCRR